MMVTGNTLFSQTHIVAQCRSMRGWQVDALMALLSVLSRSHPRQGVPAAAAVEVVSMLQKQGAVPGEESPKRIK